jgi:hypothetical protein
MNALRTAGFALILCAWAGAGALAELRTERTIAETWFTGRDYLAADEERRRAYVLGAYDLLLFLAESRAFLGRSDTLWINAERLRKCTHRWTEAQLEEAFSAYLKEHPQNWDFAGGGLFTAAMRDRCG